ncbi:carbamoyltransferase HypF [Lentzea sp. BCCO 10_0798]|uniref:Carbamoyltransferase n=1 Tax=Lentzea kristufekii TaxID=3095430 RepID=A0ABU4TV43_9PSEU|nr:carbamoyltransferase HypF [Lentzea sp. BCCO 10_0798]MDX8052173.1 carbamoyltransferase HypF [Lentzea sp. BCCO 10_0798]
MFTTERIEVHGAVQGVGFRPHVFRLATELGIHGDVRNVGGHVVITACGPPDTLSAFRQALLERAPRHARIDNITVTPHEDSRRNGFVVRDSGFAAGPRTVVPDLATCDACVAELFDPGDRRHRYPFINCTDCGPRATIVESMPYDRSRTTMRGFPLCDSCSAEYHDPADRRFHAEPVACPGCGPRLRWGAVPGGEALRLATAAIARGGIVAVKGIGGYQLVCDASDEAAVARLRKLKHRPRKPLAVMVRDLTAARELSDVDEEAAELMHSPSAPIIVLPARAGVMDVGLFLPHSPLHHLLMHDLARPLVVTSGNRSGEPIVISDEEAEATLGPLVDGVLSHNRPILTRYDDSVVRAGRMVRRARGFAPASMPLPVSSPAPVLALGAQLKHTTALAIGDRAVLGPHTGDLENTETLTAFERTAEALCRWQGVVPEYCAHDLHPRYLSTRYAGRWARKHRIPVQHHHAHVAATAAEHGVRGRFIGVAYDGLGLGDDGTLWGGEILLATYGEYRRVGRFGRAPLPGGEVAVRRPSRMALGYLHGAEDFGAPSIPDVRPTPEGDLVRRMIERQVNSPLASSAGRLFDAAAALLGLCEENSYEGEAAVVLEAVASNHEGPALDWKLHRRDGMWVYDPVPTLRDLVTCGDAAGVTAARFHTTIAEVTAALVREVAGGVRTVCLGGGVFQNRRLVDAVVRELGDFQVLVGERVPVNDGGISYGQAAVAAALLAGGDR